RSVNNAKTKAPLSLPLQAPETRIVASAAEQPASTHVRAPASNKLSRSKRPELVRLLSEITDVPVGEIKDESSLEDLGIDSLMATEVLNNVRSVLGLTIDLTTFTFFPDV